MKPIPPVKPIEKLPETYHLTIVKDPDKQSGWYSVVLTQMQGGEVRRRVAIDPAEPNMDLAMDSLMKVATRVFYFNQPEEYL